MPKSNDTVHLRFTLKGQSGPFWQTNATVASVANGTALLDGLDRQIAARIADFAEPGRAVGRSISKSGRGRDRVAILVSPHRMPKCRRSKRAAGRQRRCQCAAKAHRYRLQERPFNQSVVQ